MDWQARRHCQLRRTWWRQMRRSAQAGRRGHEDATCGDDAWDHAQHEVIRGALLEPENDFAAYVETVRQAVAELVVQLRPNVSD
jgi:hypothetical protein